jgi:hypothetical protein
MVWSTFACRSVALAIPLAAIGNLLVAVAASREDDEFSGIAAAKAALGSAGGSPVASAMGSTEDVGHATEVASKSWFRTLKLQGDISGK